MVWQIALHVSNPASLGQFFEILESEVNRRCSTSRTRAVGEEDLWNRLVSEVGSHETAQPAKKKREHHQDPPFFVSKQQEASRCSRW